MEIYILWYIIANCHMHTFTCACKVQSKNDSILCDGWIFTRVVQFLQTSNNYACTYIEI